MSAYMERFAPNRSLATFHLWRSFDKALETQDKRWNRYIELVSNTSR